MPPSFEFRVYLLKTYKKEENLWINGRISQNIFTFDPRYFEKIFRKKNSFLLFSRKDLPLNFRTEKWQLLFCLLKFLLYIYIFSVIFAVLNVVLLNILYLRNVFLYLIFFPTFSKESLCDFFDSILVVRSQAITCWYILSSVFFDKTLE